MPRPKSVSAPAYRLHKPSGRAVVEINRKVYYLGAYGSRESKAAYDALISRWLANGRSLTDCLGMSGGGAHLMASPVAQQSATRTEPMPGREGVVLQLNVGHHTVLPPDSLPSQLPAPVEGHLTLVELMTKYLEHAQVYYGASEELDNMKDVMATLKAMFPRLPLPQFGPLALVAVRDAMIMGTHRPGARRAKPLARPTINARINRIRRIFRWGVSRQLVHPHVLASLESVEPLKCGHTTAREPKPVKPVDWATVEATLPHLPDPVPDMVRIQYLTGCRSGEVCSMRTGDIDRSGDVWIYRPRHHKTAYRGHTRVIWLGPRCQRILQAYLKADPDSYLFSPAVAARCRNTRRRRARKTPMTPSQRARMPKRHPKWQPGACYTPNTYGQAVARGCKQAAVGSWHPHQLRHSRATQLRREYGVDAAQTILGHHSLDATQIYAEADHNRASSIMSQAG